MSIKSSLLEFIPSAKERKHWPWNTEVDPTVYHSKKHWPKISIVTPSYNQGKFIEETIRSIILQNYPNLELIIIDGGSTDETVEILHRYGKWIAYWVSEKDRGQADAINKGVSLCTGEVFNWINSDDKLAPYALHEIGTLFQTNYTIAGRVYNFHLNNPELDYFIQNRDLDLTTFLSFTYPFHQPGIWYDLERFKLAGKLPIQYSYNFDRIFLLRYLLDNKSILYTDKVLVYFRMHDNSKTATIMNDKTIELVEHFRLMITDNTYSNYRKIIKTQLSTYLLPVYLINKWEVKNIKNKNKVKRLLSYLLLALKNPYFISSRYYFTILKKKFISL